MDWTPSRIIDWADKIGPQCALVVQNVMAARPRPKQGFRSCLGIIRLAKAHGEARLEAAGDLTCTSPAHENVRGQEYFA